MSGTPEGRLDWRSELRRVLVRTAAPVAGAGGTPALPAPRTCWGLTLIRQGGAPKEVSPPKVVSGTNSGTN